MQGFQYAVNNENGNDNFYDDNDDNNDNDDNDGDDDNDDIMMIKIIMVLMIMIRKSCGLKFIAYRWKKRKRLEKKEKQVSERR